MTIVRAKRQTNFTIMSNTGLNDDRLSFKARGVLAYLLSKPDNWRVNGRALANHGPDGRTAVQSALKELEEYGYLKRERSHSTDGTWEWLSFVYDEPCADYPCAENPSTDNPSTENRAIYINTEQTNTDNKVLSKEGEGASAPPTPAPPPVIPSSQPTNTQIRYKSPHFSASDFVNGYVPLGAGVNAVQVYYERFCINQNDARLTPIKEDDLVRQCKDLDRLREVVTAYSQTNYKHGNVRLILDWYRDGVPNNSRKDNRNGNRWQRSEADSTEDEYVVTPAEDAYYREFFRKQAEGYSGAEATAFAEQAAARVVEAGL